MTPDEVQVFTKSIVDNATRLGLVWTIRQATVLDGSDPSNVFATYDGDTIAIPMQSIVGSPEPNARVWAIEVPPAGNYIIGFVTTAPLRKNEECLDDFSVSPGGTTTSATYVNVPGPQQITFIKASSLSDVKTSMAGTFFSTTTVAGAAFAANFVGPTTATYDVAHVASTNASLNAHTSYSGFIKRSDLPAGLYVVTAQWKRTGGTGTLNIDSNDMFDMCVEEVA